jgi:hypothetical protein
MSCASRRVGRKGERRVEDSGGRTVLAGMLLVRGTEPLTADSGLRRVDMVACGLGVWESRWGERDCDTECLYKRKNKG